MGDDPHRGKSFARAARSASNRAAMTHTLDTRDGRRARPRVRAPTHWAARARPAPARATRRWRRRSSSGCTAGAGARGIAASRRTSTATSRRAATPWPTWSTGYRARRSSRPSSTTSAPPCAGCATRAGEFGLDATSLALWGSSAGGHLAALAATTAVDDRDRVQAVVDGYGPTDFTLADAQALPGGLPHAPADSPESELLGVPLAEAPADLLRASQPDRPHHGGRAPVPDPARDGGSARPPGAERDPARRARGGGRRIDAVPDRRPRPRVPQRQPVRGPPVPRGHHPVVRARRAANASPPARPPPSR